MNQTQIGKKFGVSQMAVSKWKAEGAPLHDLVELCDWLDRSKTQMHEETRAGIERVRIEYGVSIKIKPVMPEDGKEVYTAEDFRRYYAEKLSKAQREDSMGDIRYWNDLFIKTDKSIRESEAHAKKLGIDRGEMLARSEVERIIRIWMYAGNACIKSVIHQIAERVAGMNDPEEVYKFLCPVVIGGRIFEGLSKVSKAEGVKLEKWFIEAVQSEGENYLKEK